ncbi:MAG: ABC transporter permease [Bryobacteraceae bacterium]
MFTQLRVWDKRIRAFFRTGGLDRDFDRELESHVALLAEDNMRGGMTPEDARRAALLRVGNLEANRELHREARGLPALDVLLQDLRYTFRTLRRDIGFTIFAILIAGLGIGASATIFSVVNALLLRPLPFRDPGRLVWIATASENEGLSGQTVPVGHFLDLRAQNRSFSDIAAYFAFYGTGDSKLTGNGEPQRLSDVPVSQNFFAVLGVTPQMGRTFTAEECSGHGPKAVLVSYGLWKRRFASDPGIVGRPITLNDAPVTVIGVLPASFDFATVFAPGSRIDLYSPFPMTPETDRWGNTLAMIGRLKPEVSAEQAQAELGVLGPQIQRRDPNRDFRPRLTLLEKHVSGRIRPALFVLSCAVGVVMLIVCANLSNLLLARSAARQKELAIRAALGAGRGRLVRQLLTESVVLSCCGAGLGLTIAALATRTLSQLDSINIPLLQSVQLDGAALVFTLAVAVLTGLLVGVIPALQVPAMAVHDALKDSHRGSSAGKRHTWIRGALVVSEMAFACVLLVGAGLLIRSFLRILDVNLGFQPERAAAMRVDASSQYSTQAKRNAYYDEALRLVRDARGIEAAGLTDVLPLGRNRTWGVAAKGRVYSKDHPPPFAFVRIVSDGYLRAMGIPLRAGRDFTERDTPSSEGVIIVNETLARALWPGENPIGQMVTQDGGRRVVGVVGDVRHLAVERASGAEMYLPIRQTNDYASVDLVARTALPPAGLASEIRAALRPLDPNLPANEFRTLQQIVDRAISPRRFVVMLLAGFSAFALILASLGIYAVISYSVNQRTQELGIRMALGASAGDVQARIMVQTLGLAGLGMLIGAAVSWMLARALASLLFGVTATDPATFCGVLAVLGAVAAVAGYVPARRASRIDPMVALRAE